MDLETIQKYLGKAIYFLFGTLLFLFLVSLLALEGNKKSPEAQNQYIRARLADKIGLDVSDNYPKPWPPAMNAEYPDYELIDQEGIPFKISDHKGKVIIIEMVDMSSPVSQANSNAAEFGLFGTTDKYDEYAKPIEKLISEYTDGDVVLPLSNVVIIKVIVLSQDGKQPTTQQAEEWAAFFRLKKEDNIFVAVPVKDLRGKTTETITPGYQLIDSDMMLRVDSAGPEPKHNLELTLVPQLPKLLGR